MHDGLMSEDRNSSVGPAHHALPAAAVSSTSGPLGPPAKPHPDAGKIFVGGLSRETTTSGLQEYFQRFGEISDCVVMKDRTTGLPRGFGFVTYASHTVAERVRGASRRGLAAAGAARVGLAAARTI